MPGEATKKLLILDLDETLIHATEQRLDGEPDFKLDPYFVYRRPYLTEFLEFAFTHFEVAVWTSSSMPYAQSVVRAILPAGRSLKFLWARERCITRRSFELQSYYWVKDLKKVRRAWDFPLERIIMVDDSPEKLERQYGNLVRVEAFLGAVHDDELLKLPKFLSWLDEHEDVRGVEKRGWKFHPAVSQLQSRE